MSLGRRIANDWYDSTIPDNVTFDATNLIDTSYSFRRFRSQVKNALVLGRGSAIYANSGFDLGPHAHVEIGEFTMINGAEIVCDEEIRIGAYSLISWNVLLDGQLPRSPLARETACLRRRDFTQRRACNKPPGKTTADRRRRQFWIGHDCVVLPGVTIGSGSIIGARSVVFKSVPELAVAVGNPARVIRRLDAAR